MECCDVLLIGTMGNIGCTVQRSLTAQGLRVEMVPFLQNVCRDMAGYRRELIKALCLFSPRVIWPIGHPLALSILYHKAVRGEDTQLQELLQDVTVPVEDEEKIRRLDSKCASSVLAMSLDIAQPRLYASPDEVEHWPVIFKRDHSFGGSGVMRPYTRESLVHLILNEGNRPYLIEDYVEGEDVSVDCVRWGSTLYMGCYRSLARKQRQGPSLLREPCDNAVALGYARRLLEYIDWQGVCGMDFRVREDDGHPLFLECNPRFTGGLDTHIAAGFDIPCLWHQLICQKRQVLPK